MNYNLHNLNNKDFINFMNKTFDENNISKMFINFINNTNINAFNIIDDINNINEYRIKLKKYKRLINDLIDKYKYLINYYNIQNYTDYSIINKYSKIKKKSYEYLLKDIHRKTKNLK